MKRYFCLTMLIAAVMLIVSCGNKRMEQGTEAGSQTGTGEFPSTENGQQEENEEKLTVTEDGYIVVDYIFLEMDEVELREAYIKALNLSEDIGFDELYLPGDPFKDMDITVRSTEIVLDEEWIRAESEKEATDFDRYIKYGDLIEELTMPFLEELRGKYGFEFVPSDDYIFRNSLVPAIFIHNVNRDTIKRMIYDETIEVLIDPFRIIQF